VGPVADAPIRWLDADYWLQRFRANAGPADALERTQEQYRLSLELNPTLPASPETAYVLAQLLVKAERESEAAPLLRLVVQIGSDVEMVEEAHKRLEEIERISPP
jgi:hypothetical protein